MKLPCGVTGFTTHPIKIDGKFFKTCCYTVARQIGADLMECEATIGVARNYYYAVFRNNQLKILCNPYYGFITFSANEAGTFADEPQLAQLFSQFDSFHVLTSTNLEIFPEHLYLTDLNESELTQINYWKPSRLGDIIFNFWD